MESNASQSSSRGELSFLEHACAIKVKQVRDAMVGSWQQSLVCNKIHMCLSSRCQKSCFLLVTLGSWKRIDDERDVITIIEESAVPESHSVV